MKTPVAADSSEDDNDEFNSPLSEPSIPSSIHREEEDLNGAPTLEETLDISVLGQSTLSLANILDNTEELDRDLTTSFNATESEEEDSDIESSMTDDKKLSVVKLNVDGSNWYEVRESILSCIRDIGGVDIWLDNKKPEELTSKEKQLSTKLLQMVLNHFSSVIKSSVSLTKTYGKLSRDTAQTVYKKLEEHMKSKFESHLLNCETQLALFKWNGTSPMTNGGRLVEMNAKLEAYGGEPKTDKELIRIFLKQVPEQLGDTLVRIQRETATIPSFSTLDGVITELENTYTIKKRAIKISDNSHQTKAETKPQRNKKGKGKKKPEHAMAADEKQAGKPPAYCVYCEKMGDHRRDTCPLKAEVDAIRKKANIKPDPKPSKGDSKKKVTWAPTNNIQMESASYAVVEEDWQHDVNALTSVIDDIDIGTKPEEPENLAKLQEERLEALLAWPKDLDFSLSSIPEERLLDTDYIIDSGATRHMCQVKGMFNELEKTPNPIAIRVTTGARIFASHQGSINIKGFAGKQILLQNVLYVPQLFKPLFSIVYLTANGGMVKIDKDSAEIILNDEVVGKGIRVNNLFVLRTTDEEDAQIATAYEVIQHEPREEIAFVATRAGKVYNTVLTKQGKFREESANRDHRFGPKETFGKPRPTEDTGKPRSEEDWNLEELQRKELHKKRAHLGSDDPDCVPCKTAKSPRRQERPP